MHDDSLNYSYALSKQLGKAYARETSYGQITLDDEMRAAVEAALRPILLKRLSSSAGVSHG